MQKKIKKILPGDFVKSWDFENKKVVKSKVLKVWKHKNEDKCFNINDNLIITGSHEVYTQKGYKLTKDIKIGDELLLIDGKYVKVKSFKIYNSKVPYVHNLTVKINNYFANGVLVHNGGGGWTKAGRWHGNDGVVDASMQGLRDAIIGYQESTELLDSHTAAQGKDIRDTLDLQRTEMSNKFAKLGNQSIKAMSEFNANVGKTNLAQVGGAQKDMLQKELRTEQQTMATEREGVHLKSQQEQAELARNAEKEKLSMKQMLRGEINRAYSTNVESDRYWAKKRGNNVFAGDMSPEGMIEKWDEGPASGYYRYCVEPNTLVDMWD